MPANNNYTDPATWFTINDFSTGIISNSNYAYGAGNNSLSVPAQKPGAAQASGTQNCIALPNGGLGPLPGVQSTVVDPNAIAPAYISGTLAYGPISSDQYTLSAGTDELLIAYEKVIPGVGSGTRTWTLNAYNPATTANQVIQTRTGATPNIILPGPNTYYSLQATSMVLSEANSSSYLSTGVARVFYCHCMVLASPVTDTNAYPSFTTPASGGFTAMLGTVTVALPQWLIAHQNRIVGIQYVGYGVNNAEWRSSFATAMTFPAAEWFNYTDPPNGITFGAQFENFVQENPVLHGAWGSINASELFFVRMSGGGYQIEGDLNTPTVVRLPGVISTNGACQVAGSTPIGIVYGSNNNGVWVWNGGNASVKLSNQLNDDFFMLNWQNSAAPFLSYPAGPMFNFNVLGDLIYCPNGWVYSITLNSWWQWAPIVPTTGQFTLNSSSKGRLNVNKLAGNPAPSPMAWFWPTFDGQGIWAFPQWINNTSDNVAYRLSRTSPATQWTWQSYPMPFSQNRLVNVRKVAVRAQGTGTIFVTFTNPDGTTPALEPMPFNFSNVRAPNLIMASAGAEGTDITMSITSTGSNGGPAPVLYEISIGYEVRQETNPT